LPAAWPVEVGSLRPRLAGLLSGSLIPLPRYRAPHAHSIASDPATHLLYVPLEDVSGRPTLRILAFEP
jgi:hypothetical protein